MSLGRGHGEIGFYLGEGNGAEQICLPGCQGDAGALNQDPARAGQHFSADDDRTFPPADGRAS